LGEGREREGSRDGRAKVRRKKKRMRESVSRIFLPNRGRSDIATVWGSARGVCWIKNPITTSIECIQHVGHDAWLRQCNATAGQTEIITTDSACNNSAVGQGQGLYRLTPRYSLWSKQRRQQSQTRPLSARSMLKHIPKAIGQGLVCIFICQQEETTHQ